MRPEYPENPPGSTPELGRSAHPRRNGDTITDLTALICATLTTLVVATAIAGSTHWPLVAVMAVAALAGVLVGAVSRAIADKAAGGGHHHRRNLVGRAAVGLAGGVIVGELATLVVLGGSVDRQLDARAARDADATPAVMAASASLDRARSARTALDGAVDHARRHREDALIVARCEYHPTPSCPQTHITGVPGVGPETRTAQDFLADAQRELNQAVAVREQQAPDLDNDVVTAERELTRERETAAAAADRGLAARWTAMNDYSRSHPSALLLRLAMIVTATLLIVLPWLLRTWRGETSRDRHTAARAEVERAELAAETAIAVKRAEVRAAAQTLWAEQQLTKAQLAIAAQTEIDEAQQRHRVADAVGETTPAPLPIASQRAQEPPDEEVYLPIAAAAEAASHALSRLPAVSDELPAQPDAPGERAAPPPRAPAPDLARAAARWIRPLVPNVVARAIDTTMQPVRSMQQMFEGVREEVEEITFSLKRTHRINFGSRSAAEHHSERVPATDPTPEPAEEPPAELHRTDPRRELAADGPVGLPADAPRALSADGPPALPAGGPPALPAGGPPALPPG